MTEAIRRRWCRWLHNRVMFPGGREYECATCGLRWINPAWHGPANAGGDNAARVVALKVVREASR